MGSGTETIWISGLSLRPQGLPHAVPGRWSAAKVEGVYPLECEIAEDVTEQLPAFIETYNARRLHSSLGYLSPEQYESHHTRPPVEDAD